MLHNVITTSSALPPPARPRRVPVWVFVGLFWALVALMYATQVALGPRPPNEPGIFTTQLIWQSTYYLAWIPVTLLVWSATHRWDLETLGWPRFLALHAAIGTMIALAHALLVFVIAWNIVPVGSPTEPGWQVAWSYIRTRLHTQFLIYASIVGTGQAVDFYNRYREGQVAAAQLEAQLASARLDTLRAQLQPHFLFNSLHSIASLARAGDTAGVVRLISGFGELLRHLLDSSITHHSVREELALVDRYLEIQRVRFGDRLRVTIKASDDAAGARIPLLIVQPLVENALRHGLAPRIEVGRIGIDAVRQGPMLVLRVEDDGEGLSAGWIFGTTGTGLRNLETRLSVEFAGEHSISVLPREGGGVRAEVCLPFITA